MKLMTPWGLAALAGILLLLIIYLIRPAYQSKLIPSTYIWKRGLKLRKKKHKTSQILSVAAGALILSLPFIRSDVSEVADQTVFVLDASADMMAESGGRTRFDRAVTEMAAASDASIAEGRSVTVIWAGDKAQMAVQAEQDAAAVRETLETLTCTFGEPDTKGAMELVNAVTRQNERTEVFFYTSHDIRDAEDIQVVNLSADGEWNMAVTDARAELRDNLYEFYVDVAMYGATKSVDVTLSVRGVNEDGKTVTATRKITLDGGARMTVDFKDFDENIYEYDSIEATVTARDQTRDSFAYDNRFVRYGGKKEPIRVQYVSSQPNNFFSGMLGMLWDIYADRWDITFDQVNEPSRASTKGYDFYIFEHTVPADLPRDGVVFLMSPDSLPNGVDLILQGERRGDFHLSKGVSHPITRYVDPAEITLTRYCPIGLGTGYRPLLQCEGDNVLVVNDRDKVVVSSVDLNYSNLALLPEFSEVMINTFDYFLPVTVEGTVFDVNEEIPLTGRGTNPRLLYGEEELPLEIPSAIRLDRVGVYRILQDLESGKKARSVVFIKVPASESDFDAETANTDGLFDLDRPERADRAIYWYAAILLLCLLALERFLHSLKTM